MRTVRSEQTELRTKWAPSVPDGWKIRRMRDAVDLMNGYPFSSELFSNSPEAGPRIVRIRDLRGDDDPVYWAGSCVDEGHIRNGDILIGMDGDFNVTIWQRGPAYLNQRMCCVRAREGYSSRFIAYLFPAPLQVINDLTYYTTVKHLSSTQVLDIRFPAPPLPTQKAIASFLDRKTAVIDALIAKKERLIELLEEKRAALINRAVTKGLDPDVPTRATVSPFFPSIPKTWQMTRVKFVTNDIADGPHFSPAYIEEEDGGVMFISARNVKVDRWQFGDAKFISHELHEELCKRITPQRGDVLYTKGGTTGVARAVDFDRPFHVWVHVAVLRLRQDLVVPEYVAQVLNSSGAYAQAQLFTRGATNNDLGLTRMAEIHFPLPSRREQQRVASWLNGRLKTVDEGKQKIQQQISALQEYRQSLITAAVTGQIRTDGSGTTSKPRMAEERDAEGCI